MGATRGRLAASGLFRWRIGDDDDVAPDECSTPVPALTCVAGNGGVRSSGFKPAGPLLHPVVTGEGKVGRVNAVNPR